MYSQEQLRILALRASTIDERFSDRFEPISDRDDRNDPAARRYDAWCRSTSGGDPVLVAKRLARDGLSETFVRARLGPVRLAEGTPLPSWAEDASWIAAALHRADTVHDQPFLELVAEAERRRNAMLPSRALDRVAPAARVALARDLSNAAAKLFAPVLHEELSRDALRLFELKPVLLRLLASITRQWIEASAELLARLDADVETVRRELLGRSGPTLVTAIETGLSDPHNFGRSVCLVRFSDGTALVYKPKDLRVDLQWARLIDWLNAREPPIDLRAARVLAMESYGWCEYIAHANCLNRTEAQRFFRRGGALLALAYLLAGGDLHHENLIAAGEHPVAIDLEMMLQTRVPGGFRDAPAMQALEQARRRLAESVQSTGLLPSYVQTRGMGVLDIGGFSHQAGRHDNLPELGGRPLRLGDYSAELAEGCEAYLRFVLGQRDALLAADGPLEAFGRAPVRRILKSTNFYFLLLERVRNHRDMHDGATWSAHLDFVSRLADWDVDVEAAWPLFAAERRALADLNVPFFVQSADIERARHRINALDEADIAWQLHVVRLSSLEGLAHKARRVEPHEAPPMTSERALALADAIAHRLARCATRASEGAAWLGLDPLANGGWALRTLGQDLYGGAPGLALFFAAHAALRGNAASADLARAALLPVRYLIASNGAERFARVEGLGGAAGIGSIVYALTVCAGLLDDATLYADACRTAMLLKDEVIAGDTIFDIVGGAAGAILGLLALYRATGDERALERARACGHHLMRKRPEGENRIWRHQTDVPLTGLSHGAAGFAYALAALATAADEPSFGAAARDCISYEDRLFSETQANWPDLRLQNSCPSYPAQWCHGAGGIGLARLGMIRFGDAGLDLHEDVYAAIAAVQRAWPSRLDTLCCGALGVGELLTEAGRTLGRPDLQAQAARRLTGIVDAAEAAGSFAWNAGGDDENLGFFRGLSGVGYTLLRHVAPERLPNVLIWE